MILMGADCRVQHVYPLLIVQLGEGAQLALPRGGCHSNAQLDDCMASYKSSQHSDLKSRSYMNLQCHIETSIQVDSAQ